MVKIRVWEGFVSAVTETVELLQLLLPAKYSRVSDYAGPYLSLFWKAGIIINIHWHKSSIFFHFHVDKRIQTLKISLLRGI